MEAAINFQEIEKKIFDFACEFARNITAAILLSLDENIKDERDKKRYRLKDKIKTTVKTVYGEVSFRRRYYYDEEEQSYTFLLDEEIGLKKAGLFSGNMAELVVKSCISDSYRKASEEISRATGQSISSVGAWKLVQEVGNRIAEEEEQNIKDMNMGIRLGCKKPQVLFQEADGVWLSQQKNKKKAPKMELKIATSYEGWRDDTRHRLVNKKIVAAVENGRSFMKRREAFVRSIYDLDNIEYKLLNGDGAGWIHMDEVTYQQLDQFHLFQEITRKITNKNIRKLFIDNLHEKKIAELLENIETYINSIDDGKQTKKKKDADDLYGYVLNNRDGLLKYSDVIDLPEAPEGMVYRNMGVQENQNCTLITMRMKNRRMSWSAEGATNLAKVICSNANGDLERYIRETFEFKIPVIVPSDDFKADILSASDIPLKVGKKNINTALITGALPVMGTDTPVSRLIRQLINQ